MKSKRLLPINILEGEKTTTIKKTITNKQTNRHRNENLRSFPKNSYIIVVNWSSVKLLTIMFGV